MIRRATTGKVGDNQHTHPKADDNIIKHKRTVGTSKDYTLDRLDRERPGPFYRL